MRSTINQQSWSSLPTESRFASGNPLAAQLLAVVDLGLLGVFVVAPFFFGGRHELGRLVLVSLIGLVAIAWFVRQCLLPTAAWTRTLATGLVVAAVAVVGLQIVPLPSTWHAWLSPETASLLPLWGSQMAGGQLGKWTTTSFTPHETQLALAMLVSYGLLFIVLTQRLQKTADVEKLLNGIAVAAVIMAVFGLLQFFASNGQFFWCITNPYRSTEHYAMGSFFNRNHFASFLVLGVGPLARWLVSELRARKADSRRHMPMTPASLVVPGFLLSASLIVFLAIALSLSRGGAIALFVALLVLSAIYWRWRLVEGKHVYAALALGIALLAMLSVYGYEQVASRLDDFTSGSIEVLDQDDGRRVVWDANLTAIQRYWLTGTGAGSHREVCPAYLSTATSKEYTHAENGYLQIVTENGILGMLLLSGAILLCCAWCVRCLANLEDKSQQLCFGAAAAGLAASLTHSLFDFVWYIPACITVTIALAVCVLRLSQFSLPTTTAARVALTWSRPRWVEATAAAVCLALWTVYTFVGPGIAAVHWDRYLRDVAAVGKLQDQRSAQHTSSASNSLRDPVSQSMQKNLELAIAWDPSFARAHLRLAARYIEQFELSQQSAPNAMNLGQIRDAAQQSTFATSDKKRRWLDRALGRNAQLLYKAYSHARAAVSLSPLQGEAYIYLSELAFLHADHPQNATAYLNQAIRVRPFDGDVEFEIGKQALLVGDMPSALAHWAHCYRSAGSHRTRIVELLAGRIPANVFLETFEPDWHSLRQIWWRYRQTQNRDDCELIATYAAQLTERDVQRTDDIPPVYLWMWQAEIHKDLARHEQALACLEAAYRCDPRVYAVRSRLGYALKNTHRLAEAEAHLRWCAARHPEDKALGAAILEITRLRTTRAEPKGFSSATLSRWQ